MRKRVKFKRTRFLDPNNHVFIYWWASDPEFPWYIRIGGLETPLFRHGISISGSFQTREDAVVKANQVIDYLRSALKVPFDKTKPLV